MQDGCSLYVMDCITVASTASNEAPFVLSLLASCSVTGILLWCEGKDLKKETEVFCERFENTGYPEKLMKDNGTRDMEADLRCLSERDICARNIHNPIIIAALSPGLGNCGVQDGLGRSRRCTSAPQAQGPITCMQLSCSLSRRKSGVPACFCATHLANLQLWGSAQPLSWPAGAKDRHA